MRESPYPLLALVSFSKMGIEDPNLMGPLLSFREIILVEAPKTLPSTQLPLIQEAKDKFTIFRG